MASEKKFCPQFVTFCYDVVAVLISIADITFHIIALIDFYQQERLPFFGISLSILIITQFLYAYFFTVSIWGEVFGMKTYDIYSYWESWITCCCCLPFAQFIPYILFALNIIQKYVDEPNKSKMSKWINNTLDKQYAFCIQAMFESFPQSILMIVAIVYYDDANYIYVTSLLLSIFSVIIKSIVLSTGSEIYTFIWSWLCVATDYFGIFFMVTWLFYAHDEIQEGFLGYFDILFVDIWIWKFAVSTLLPGILALIVFLGIIYWLLSCVNFLEMEDDDTFFKTFLVCCWIILTPIMMALAVILVFIICFVLDLVCFTIIAYIIYDGSTVRINNYSQYIYDIDTEKNVSLIVDFLSNGKHKNRGLRILAVNYGLHKVDRKRCAMLCQFVDKSIRKDGYGALRDIKRSDIRHECADPVQANLMELWKFKVGELLKIIQDPEQAEFVGTFGANVISKTLFILICIFGPIFVLSKILHLIYPWIIVGYLGYNNLILTNTIDTLQMIMLWIYIGLQFILFLLGIKVFKINYWLRHIEAGKWNVFWNKVNTEKLEKEMWKFFNTIFWSTEIQKIILEHFGYDVGDIILCYCKELKLEEDVEAVEHIEDASIVGLAQIHDLM